ncbi:MAG: hypothetical protein J6S19_01490, partial [Lentisphaeria bacterium]|nr:hypothetical protein [Lentisphaeria bacterium]
SVAEAAPRSANCHGRTDSGSPGGRSIGQTALGFQINEATAEELVDKNSGELLEVLKRRTVTKDVPPDVRALLFYLKNCWPERWSESQSENYSYTPEDEEKNL